MNHPEELLADLVAGVLSPEERAVVEAHLASCDRCRRELALVRQARIALSSLELVPAPVDITLPAVQEARATGAPRARGAPARLGYRAIQIAAAAAIVAVVAIALPHLGRSPDTTTGAGAAAYAEPAVVSVLTCPGLVFILIEPSLGFDGWNVGARLLIDEGLKS